MTLNITPGEGTFGDFSDKEIRTMVFETAQALYRPAHDILVSTHAGKLRDWADKPHRGRVPDSNPPAFDDAILEPVWTACLARARAHVSEVLGVDLALVAATKSPSQVRDVPGAPRGPVN